MMAVDGLESPHGANSFANISGNGDTTTFELMLELTMAAAGRD